MTNLTLDTWLQERRRSRRARAALQSSAPSTPPPTDLEEFLELCTWPDESTGRPVQGLTAITRDYIRSTRRTAFRFDVNAIKPGADIIAKPRKVKMTSCILGCIQYCMIHYPGTRWLTVLHTLAAGGAQDIYDRMMMSIAWQPGWSEITSRTTGRRIQIVSCKSTDGLASEWMIATAGSSESIADAIGRGGTVHGIHLSEADFYRAASTTYGAARNAGPEDMVMVAESTFNRPDCWFSQQYYATQPGGGGGVFLEGFFWPWHQNPERRLSPGDPRYDRVMNPEFESEMDEADLIAERKLELDEGQRAWRRSRYCVGKQADRERARREHPEDDTTWAVHSGDSWFDVERLQVALADCVEPVETHEVTPLLVVYIYDTTGRVVAGIDRADRHGDDYSAAVFLDHTTRDTVAVIHGKALASEMAEAVEWTLARLEVGKNYMLCPERNRDFGLIGELDKRSLKMHTEKVIARHGPKKVKREVTKRGIYMGDPMKRKICNLMGEWLHNEEHPGPSCQLRHTDLVLEIRSMRDTGKPSPEAVSPDHDDLADAWGIALYCAEVSKVGGSAKVPSLSAVSRPKNRRPR